MWRTASQALRRSFALHLAGTAILVTAILIGSSSSYADRQLATSSTWSKFPDPAGDISAIVNSQTESESDAAIDCAHSDAADDDKSDPSKAREASGGDNDSDAASANTDEGDQDDHNGAAQATKSGSDQKDDQSAADGDNHGCEPPDAQDAEAGDSGDEQDVAEAPAPDDEKRNFEENKVAFYRDSQGYRTASVSSHNHLLLDNFVLDLNHDTVAASDAAGSVRSEDTMFSFLGNVNENLALGGGFGTVMAQGWSLPIGSLKAAINLAGATLEAGVSRSLLAISADTIRNRVMQTDASAMLSYDVTENFAPSLEFHHIYYSDHNSSIGVEFTPQYTFHLKGSQLQVGYDLNYESFATNPNSGYWAPQHLLANKLTGAWKFDRGYYFGQVEMSLGPESARQTNSQPGSPQGGFATGAGALFGFRPSENMVFECNFAGDRSPGWNSAEIGFGIKYFF
jgi:hypothetical protein